MRLLRRLMRGGSVSSKLPARSRAAVPAVHEAQVRGDGTFSIEVIGESRYQPALERASGGRSENGVDVLVTAELVLEDSNPNDRFAVMVKVNDDCVGYLPRDSARDFRRRIALIGVPEGVPIVCRARIVGGWLRKGGLERGDFGIRLDFQGAGQSPRAGTEGASPEPGGTKWTEVGSR